MFSNVRKVPFNPQEDAVNYLYSNRNAMPTSNMHFSLIMYAVEEPRNTSIILSESIPEILYDLQTMENTYLLVSLDGFEERKILEMYIICKNRDDLEYINILDDTFGKIFMYTAASLTPPENRKFMPNIYRAHGNEISIYVGQLDGFVFAYFHIANGIYIKHSYTLKHILQSQRKTVSSNII